MNTLRSRQNAGTMPDKREPFWAPVVIRVATAGDRRALARLAELDSTSLPAGEIVMGELHGRPVVAVAVGDGTVIADPFEPTREIAALVSLRAQQLAPARQVKAASGERRRGKAHQARTKGLGRETGSFRPMYRRLSQLILRTT